MSARPASPKAASASSLAAFDFKQYMLERAALIDDALDKAVPLQYPEVINEAMRYSLLAGVVRVRVGGLVSGWGGKVCRCKEGGGRGVRLCEKENACVKHLDLINA